MKDFTSEILELIRLTACDLPAETEAAICKAQKTEEPGSSAWQVLDTILENIRLARSNSTPICQDTGTPIFYIEYPQIFSTRLIKDQIRAALEQATKKAYLRPNAVDPLNGINHGNAPENDEFYPVIHFQEVDGEVLKIHLMLKGGGCENVGCQYKLPDVSLQAGRDLKGVKKVLLDAIYQAQGKGCAPGILGVAIGGDRSSAYTASKEVFLRPLQDTNPDPLLAELEEDITKKANLLGIGPMGFGGKTTLLGTKIKSLHRLPASYFVSISYMCWAFRRRTLQINAEEVQYF